MTEEKRREKAAEQERQRKHRKLFEDYANDLPKPGPDGIVHVPRRDAWGRKI